MPKTFEKIDNYTMKETRYEEKVVKYKLPELIGRRGALVLAIKDHQEEIARLDILISEGKKLGLKEKRELI